MTRVKICGCMRVADAIAAAEAGADFIGVMFADSRRRVSAQEAAQIVRAVGTPLRELEQDDPPPLHPGRFETIDAWFAHGAEALDRLLARKRPLVVGVFKDQDPEEINEIADETGIDLVQLSGSEPWSDCLLVNRPAIKVLRPQPNMSAADVLAGVEPGAAIAFMLDPSHGTGTMADWDAAADVADRLPLWLAGGLSPDNVVRAIRSVRPWAVDVSSGVEIDGVKDAARIAEFVRAVRKGDRSARVHPMRSKQDSPIQGRRDAALAPSPSSETPRTGRTRPRLPAFDYTGRYAYHFEVNTNHRVAVLKDGVAETVVADLARAANATSFEMLAYCVMPDHVHILGLGISEDANAVSFMQRFKQLTGFRFAKTFAKPFWQQSFFDHAARLEEDLLPIARYILDNPVAAGLVATGEEWPWTGGTLLAGEDSGTRTRGDGAKAASLRPPIDEDA